jgi:hypothetical protein
MISKNWLIVLLVLLGAGLVILKNRDKSPASTTPETTQISSAETVAPAQESTEETAKQIEQTEQKPEVQEQAPENVSPAAEPTQEPEATIPAKKTEEKPAPEQPAKTVTPAVVPAEVKPVTAPVSQAAQERTISIENKITKQMLGYRYFGTHYPTMFKITANGTEIKPESKEFIKLADNQLTVRYTFEFLYGKRKGAKEITFAVKPQADNLSIAFDWKDTWRILIDKDKAEPISGKQIE